MGLVIHTTHLFQLLEGAPIQHAHFHTNLFFCMESFKVRRCCERQAWVIAEFVHSRMSVCSFINKNFKFPSPHNYPPCFWKSKFWSFFFLNLLKIDLIEKNFNIRREVSLIYVLQFWMLDFIWKRTNIF